MKSTKPELREETWSIGGRSDLTSDLLFYRLEWDTLSRSVKASQYRAYDNEYHFKRAKFFKTWDEANSALSEAGYQRIE
ncbi:MAG: hypothetical protein ACREJQ_07015 [bacterium]